MPEANKTEQATPQRRKKAREQGQVVRSRELSAVLATAGVIATMAAISRGGATHWTQFYRALLDEAATGSITPTGPVLFWSVLEVLRWLVPVLLAALALSVTAGFAQGGFTVAPAALAPKWERLNPSAKLGQLFSITGFSNILRSLLPFGAIAWIGVAALTTHWGELVGASSMSTRQFAMFVTGAAYTIAWRSGLVLIAWAGVEYFTTWRKSEGDLRMSKEDLKEEMKQTDGNPHTRMRMRRVRRQMRRRFSRKEAKTATVVVTNPTHYAVALRYENGMAAPLVVAKGLDLLAQEIKAIAAEEGIPMMENKPLAQALYKSVEVGDSIPSALYQAVAELLVVVFRAQAELRAAEARKRNRNASGQEWRGR